MNKLLDILAILPFVLLGMAIVGILGILISQNPLFILLPIFIVWGMWGITRLDK